MGFLEDLRAIPDDELNDVTLGYPDKSEGLEASRRLELLSPEEHRLVGRFALPVPHPLWHAGFYLPNLVDGFLERAPADPEAVAWDLVFEEYEASMAYMDLYMKIGKMPCMCFEPDLPDADFLDAKRYWDVLDRTNEARLALNTMSSSGSMLDYGMKLRAARVSFGWVADDDIL